MTDFYRLPLIPSATLNTTRTRRRGFAHRAGIGGDGGDDDDNAGVSHDEADQDGTAGPMAGGVDTSPTRATYAAVEAAPRWTGYRPGNKNVIGI